MTLGLLDWFCERFEFLTWGRKTKELSGWLEIPVKELREVSLSYDKFSIPKKSGATRTIHSPNPRLKNIQRTILRKLLPGLRCHEAAVGFEKASPSLPEPDNMSARCWFCILISSTSFPTQTPEPFISTFAKSAGAARRPTCSLASLLIREHYPKAHRRAPD